MKRLSLIIILALTAGTLMPVADAAPEWDKETLALFASLPVQEGGRVKPMDTYARFMLLKLSGKYSAFRMSEDKKIKANEWLLNCLFFPEEARDYPQFDILTSEVVTSLGLPAHAKKRDYYSYSELSPGIHKLFELARQYSDIDSKQRNPMQQQILNLAHNVSQFDQLLQFLAFTRQTFSAPAGTMMGDALGDAAPLSKVLRDVPHVLHKLQSSRDSFTEEQWKKEADAFQSTMDAVQRSVAQATALSIFPLPDMQEKQWLSPAELLAAVFEPDQQLEEALAQMERWEQLAQVRTDPEGFRIQLAELHSKVKTTALMRGEYSKVPLEVSYYRANYMFYAQWLFLLSFVLLSVHWMLPKLRGIRLATIIMTILPTVLLCIGITLRCIIRGRPPVTTLYETLLFITASIAICGIVMELINRRGIALSMVSILGTIGMFLTNKYEVKEGLDTMPSMVAVLDTNFWLSTHVTTITLGYAAGLLAAGLAHIYIFGKLFRLRRNDTVFYDSVIRMTFGVICFCFFFSLVGTVLGGIWANDSWGRFWGWDPKENGALLICIWGLIMLHARLGKYIHHMGLAVTSVIMGMIVAFSWWGVNQLGVGLHSYGFTSGIMKNLLIFWGIEGLVVVLGIAASLGERVHQPIESKSS